MKILSIILGILLVATLGGGGYLFTEMYQPALDRTLKSEAQVENLNSRTTALENELNQKVVELTQAKKEKEAEIQRVQSTKDSLITEMQQEIEDNQIQITQLADKLQVSIVDKILFASGEAEISQAGLPVLKRVGDLLKGQKDKIIRVEGHTDSIAIKGKLKEIFDSNWELSTARATHVVRFFEDEVGISGSRLEAVGMGEHQPVSSNKTLEGRAQNRRIEIALLPKK